MTTCNACKLYQHVACEHPNTCTCDGCYPHRDLAPVGPATVTGLGAYDDFIIHPGYPRPPIITVGCHVKVPASANPRVATVTEKADTADRWRIDWHEPITGQHCWAWWDTSSLEVES